jgi:hypothetical protein
MGMGMDTDTDTGMAMRNSKPDCLGRHVGHDE